MTTSARSTRHFLRADVVIGPYGCNHCNSARNWDLEKLENFGINTKKMEIMDIGGA